MFSFSKYVSDVCSNTIRVRLTGKLLSIIITILVIVLYSDLTRSPVCSFRRHGGIAASCGRGTNVAQVHTSFRHILLLHIID